MAVQPVIVPWGHTLYSMRLLEIFNAPEGTAIHDELNRRTQLLQANTDVPMLPSEASRAAADMILAEGIIHSMADRELSEIVEVSSQAERLSRIDIPVMVGNAAPVMMSSVIRAYRVAQAMERGY